MVGVPGVFTTQLKAKESVAPVLIALLVGQQQRSRFIDQAEEITPIMPISVRPMVLARLFIIRPETAVKAASFLVEHVVSDKEQKAENYYGLQ